MTKKSSKQPQKKSESIQPFQVKKRKRGRPRTFEAPDDLMDAFIEYCQLQISGKRPITKTSFKAYILVNHGYFGDLPEDFSETLKKIDLVCKAYAEEELFVGKNVAGVIFNLTNNYPESYSNSRKFEHTGSMEVKTVVKKIGSKKEEQSNNNENE